MAELIFRRFQRWIPAENTVLARGIRHLMLAVKWGKFLCVIGGILIILQAVWIVSQSFTGVPPVLLKGLRMCFDAFLPLFLELVRASLSYLWQPALLYMIIALFTKSLWWRKFWCVVGVAGFFLLFIAAVQGSSWKEYQLLPLLILQGYLFLLWLFPREIWNIIGLIVSLAFGLIILIMPDLPTAFDDFGMFGAVLTFFLGYLNLFASLIQRAVYRL